MSYSSTSTALRCLISIPVHNWRAGAALQHPDRGRREAREVGEHDGGRREGEGLGGDGCHGPLLGELFAIPGLIASSIPRMYW